MQVNPVNPDNPFAASLKAFLADRLQQAPRLCIGLSGGRDSVVLLHALSQWVPTLAFPVTLTAVHVHHGISPNADAWAAFCTDFCRSCQVSLEVVAVDVPRDSGEGLEAAARRMRHGVFADRDADWLALAHHRDDQAETLLLNLLRGSGIAGAAGMLPERPQASGPTLIRPLLDVPRAQIEDYARMHGLRWIEDESNADLHYRRNFLRHEVLPRLEEKFLGAPKVLARAASHFAEGALLLNELAAIDRAALATPAGRISLAGFNALSPARARNLLRYEWVNAGFRAPDTRWIDEALSQLSTADTLSETCLETVEGELHVYRGEVHIIRHRPCTAEDVLPWAGQKELPWAGGRVLFVSVKGAGLCRRKLVDGAVCLRARQGGERLRTNAGRPRRSLRNLLQEAAVPAWERTCLPFLWCAGSLAWVGGIGVDESFACMPGEEGLLLVWEPGYRAQPVR